MLRRDILDPRKVEAAILTCYYAVDSLRHPDWAVALASSVNDWIIAEWLEKEPRLRASIVIPARDPQAAAREIDRVGGIPASCRCCCRCARMGSTASAISGDLRGHHAA